MHKRINQSKLFFSINLKEKKDSDWLILLCTMQRTYALCKSLLRPNVWVYKCSNKCYQIEIDGVHYDSIKTRFYLWNSVVCVTLIIACYCANIICKRILNVCIIFNEESEFLILLLFMNLKYVKTKNLLVNF